jgi:hypothetical protein
VNFRNLRPQLITAEDPEFIAVCGEETAAKVRALCQSPEQQASAKALADQIEADKRRAEAQLLKEICDGADNGVYGKEGQAVAARFVSEDGTRGYYLQVGLREALAKAGLLKRSAKKR